MKFPYFKKDKKVKEQYPSMPLPLAPVLFCGISGIRHMDDANYNPKFLDIIFPSEVVYVEFVAYVSGQIVGIIERSKPAGALKLVNMQVGSRSQFVNAEEVPFMTLNNFVTDIIQPTGQIRLTIKNPSPHLVRLEAGLLIRPC